MECPKCHQITNTNDTDNKYFFGRNSDGIPFFKCEQCGDLFYVNEIGGTAHSISRGEKGYRCVPITLGFFYWVIAVGIFWFFGSNIVTWIIGGVFLWLGWSNIKIGLFSSKKLIDEMCLDNKIPLSRETEKELRKMHKME
jgi:hypothetical protein